MDPGEGEGGIVESTKLVTVTGGLLTSLEGKKVGEGELVSGNDETSVGGSDEASVSGNDVISVGGNDEVSVSGKDEISVGGEVEVSVSGKDEMSVKGKDVMSVGGKDEILVSGRDERSVTDTLGVEGDTELDKGGRDVKDVGKVVEMVVPVGVEVGETLPSEEEDDGIENENWIELVIVMEDKGRVTESDSEDDTLELDGRIVEPESEGCDDEELLGSSDDVGNVADWLLGRLEVELDSEVGLDVGVKEDEEGVELEELGGRVEVDPGSLSEKTTTEGKELVDRESVGVGVVVDCEMDDDSVLVVIEDVGLELGSLLSCELVEGSIVLEVTMGGELVDEGLSDVELGVLDVDGGCEDVDGGS